MCRCRFTAIAVSSSAEPGSEADQAVLRPRPIAPRTALVLVALSVIVVVVCSLIASSGDVDGWEASILELVNDWPDGLEPALWTLQQAGVLVAPVAVGLIIAALTRRWAYLIPFVLVLPLKLVIEKGIVKQLVDRERPFVSLSEDIVVRGTAFEGLSFPSGHATTAFATAVLVAAFLPERWRAAPILWALVVAVSRLYMGEHNVLDVVAGAAIGTAFALVIWVLVVNRLVADEATTS